MQCQICQKETKNPKFCSLNCAALNRNTTFNQKKDVNCIKCNAFIQKGWTNRKYCIECYKIYSGNYVDYNNITLKDYFNKYSKSQANAKIREKARIQLKKKNITKCQKCGYSTFIECCHIKPVSEFDLNSSIAEVNHIDNLIGLCPNCHYEFDNGLIKMADLEIESRLSSL